MCIASVRQRQFSRREQDLTFGRQANTFSIGVPYIAISFENVSVYFIPIKTVIFRSFANRMDVPPRFVYK